MKKPRIPALLVITIVFAAFTLGFFLGRTHTQNSISVSVPDSYYTEPTSQPETAPEKTNEASQISYPISINEACKEELMALPGIGEVIAERIVEYRTINGLFSVPEELLNVEGVGEKRLEEIIGLITIGG